jgi:hypothetical protein
MVPGQTVTNEGLRDYCGTLDEYHCGFYPQYCHFVRDQCVYIKSTVFEFESPYFKEWFVGVLIGGLIALVVVIIAFYCDSKLRTFELEPMYLDYPPEVQNKTGKTD